ncbi:leucine-rich repeat domain-containing protein, partial [archaeon]
MSDTTPLRALRQLQVLNLSMNQVCHLQDVAICSALEELYVRRNQIQFMELGAVARLTRLHTVWFSDNPCSAHAWYRPLLVCLLPSLVKIDDSEVTPSERSSAAALLEREPEFRRLIECAQARAGTIEAATCAVDALPLPVATSATPPRPAAGVY